MMEATVKEDIFLILIRIRFQKVVLSADIVKMYRQVALDQAENDDSSNFFGATPLQSLYSIIG